MTECLLLCVGRRSCSSRLRVSLKRRSEREGGRWCGVVGEGGWVSEVVVAMSRWDASGVSGCISRKFEGRVGVGVGERGSTAYDGMGLSRPRDCVCRCSLASLESNEHNNKAFVLKESSVFLGEEEEETASAWPGLLFRLDGGQVRLGACPGMLLRKRYATIQRYDSYPRIRQHHLMTQI